MGCEPFLDFPISDFLNAIPIIRTTHAPSLALALGVRRTGSFSSCRPEAVGGCMGRADLFSGSLRILDSPVSSILKSEIRRLPVGARRTRCQLEQCSGSAAPAASPHGGPAGVGDGWTRIPSLDSPISIFPKASLTVRTAHAPSHSSSLALALREGRACSFTSCRPGAAGRWMRRNANAPKGGVFGHLGFGGN